MEKVKEEIRKSLNDLFGGRIKDGKCIFCGTPLEKGCYCDCLKSSKFNHYFKKANDFISKFSMIFDENDFVKHKNSLMSGVKIPSKYRGVGFNDYKINTPEQENIFEAVQEYYNDAVKNFLVGKNLILTGNFGTGKTLLMSILCNRLINDYSFNVKYINSVELINEIKDSFNNNAKITTKNILNRYCSADYLFIDDLDKLNPTDYVRELLYSIVNLRYEKELPIITSFNNTIENLDEKYFGEAVVSRLLEKSTYIQFNSKNERLQ